MQVDDQAARRTVSVLGLLKLLYLPVATLILLEIFVRVLSLSPEVQTLRIKHPLSVYQLSANAVLGYEMKRNHRDDNANCMERLPFTNSHGQRDLERTLHKREGTYRVILLGDSVIAGHGMCNLEKLISGRLESMLGSRGIEVLNFGVAGYGPRSEVELLRVKGVNFNPDLVVVLFTYNDFVNFNERIGRFAFRRPEWVNTAFRSSALFRYTALRFDLLYFRSETDPYHWVEWHSEAVGKNSVPLALEMMKGLAELHGFEVVYAIWPQFTEKEIVADAELLPPGSLLARRAPEEMVFERIARQVGIRTYRLGPYFQEDANRVARDRDFTGAGMNPLRYYSRGDGVHPNERGARLGAEALAPIVLEHFSQGTSVPETGE